MAANTRQATLADLETRTTSLESELKDLGAKVDRNHEELSHSIKELREAVETLVARSNPPTAPKTLARGKGDMLEDSGTSHEEAKTVPTLPRASFVALEDETLDAFPRALDELTREHPRRAPYIDPYLGEALEGEDTRRDDRPRAWGIAREIQMRRRPA